MSSPNRDDLKQEIEMMEAQIESAEKYPTDTPQFRSALARERAELERKKQLYDQLEPKTYPPRTNQQNKALHVLFRLLADELNDAGLDMRVVLKPEIAIDWNDKTVKEHLWRPVQKAQLGKESTTELTTVEIDEVFETINRHIGEKFGLHVNFPSIEDIILKQREKSE